MRVRIAYLEDDPAQADLIRAWLETGGHRCRWFRDAGSFIKDLRGESYDLLMLDWELPDSSGIEVLGWVRGHVDWHVPILFVTHRDSERDIVQALDQGADDYMTKPVSRAVTLARVNALGRRREVHPQRDGMLEFGTYRISRDHGRITRDGQHVELTEKEFKLALMVFSNIGRLLSREHLLEAVWGVGPGLATRTVDTHISRLRRKLALVPENGWRLKAVYHHGYRLERVPAEDSNAGDAG